MLDYKNVVQEQLGNQENNTMMAGDDFYENFLKDTLRRPIGNSINEIKTDKNTLNFGEIKQDKTSLNIGTTDKKNNINPFLTIIIKSLRKAEGIFRRSAVGTSKYEKETILGKCWALEKFEAKLLLGKNKKIFLTFQCYSKLTKEIYFIHKTIKMLTSCLPSKRSNCKAVRSL